LFGDAGDLFFFSLFLGKLGLRFAGLGSILLFVKVFVGGSSNLADFVASLLTSGFLGLKGGDDGLGFLVGAKELLATESFDVRIEFDHDAQILERVLLSGSSQSGLFGRIDLALDLAGGDQAMEIGVGDERSG